MTIQGVEYEVFFGGTHYGADQDLLCCDPILDKRDAPPIEPTRWSVTHRRDDGATLTAILACCQERACTKHDLKAATGFSEHAVNAAVRKLRHDELIQVVGTTQGRARGRWLRQYAGTA